MWELSRRGRGSGYVGAFAPLRVLFLSDQPAEAVRLAGLLRRSGLDVAWSCAASAVEFRRYLHPPFDLILSAKAADGLGAQEALRVMGQEGRHLPFIVVDSSLEPDFAAACLDEGALACV